MKIIPGPTSQILASRLANELGCKILQVEFKQFPDNEVYTRIMGEVDDDVTIVQGTPTNKDFVYLLQLIDACENANHINVVIPYFGYARQDKRFKEGEAISSRAIAKTIEADHIYTINIHDERVLGYFSSECSNLDASQSISSYIKTLKLNDPMIIAPDKGSAEFAKAVASDCFSYDVLEKSRSGPEDVKTTYKDLDVFSRDVIIVDDIISTGGTIKNVTEILKDQNARFVYAACIHPVFVGNAVLKLFGAGVDDIFATDTIEHALSCISVAPVISEELKKNIISD